MARESLEEKAHKAVLNLEKKVARIYDVLMDVGAKLTHVLEYKLDYYTLPKGKVDYDRT